MTARVKRFALLLCLLLPSTANSQVILHPGGPLDGGFFPGYFFTPSHSSDVTFGIAADWFTYTVPSMVLQWWDTLLWLARRGANTLPKKLGHPSELP